MEEEEEARSGSITAHSSFLDSRLQMQICLPSLSRFPSHPFFSSLPPFKLSHVPSAPPPFLFDCFVASSALPCSAFLAFASAFELIEGKMGVSDKLQAEAVALDLDGKKWVLAGISPKVSSSLKPIAIATTANRRLPGKQATAEGEEVEVLDDDYDEEGCSTTPTGEESRIPTQLSCPPAPRKHRPPSSKCRLTRAAGVEFFTPPDLESVFVRRIERAN